MNLNKLFAFLTFIIIATVAPNCDEGESFSELKPTKVELPDETDVGLATPDTNSETGTEGSTPDTLNTETGGDDSGAVSDDGTDGDEEDDSTGGLDTSDGSDGSDGTGPDEYDGPSVETTGGDGDGDAGDGDSGDGDTGDGDAGVDDAGDDDAAETPDPVVLTADALFSLESKTFKKDSRLLLNYEGEGEIIYTLDGSEPSATNGYLFNGKKIPVSSFTTVKAAVLYNGSLLSNVVERRFGLIKNLKKLATSLSPGSVDAKFGEGFARRRKQIFVQVTGKTSSSIAILTKERKKGYVQSETIGAPEGAGTEFGRSIQINRHYLVIGDPSANGGQGAVFIYTKDDSDFWALTDTLAAPDVTDDSVVEFGDNVRLRGHSIAISTALESAPDSAFPIFVRNKRYKPESDNNKDGDKVTGQDKEKDNNKDGDKVTGQDKKNKRKDWPRKWKTVHWATAKARAAAGSKSVLIGRHLVQMVKDPETGQDVVVINRRKTKRSKKHTHVVRALAGHKITGFEYKGRVLAVAMVDTANNRGYIEIYQRKRRTPFKRVVTLEAPTPLVSLTGFGKLMGLNRRTVVYSADNYKSLFIHRYRRTGSWSDGVKIDLKKKGSDEMNIRIKGGNVLLLSDGKFYTASGNRVENRNTALTSFASGALANRYGILLLVSLGAIALIVIAGRMRRKSA